MRVYLDFIRRRATGELQTGAEWMRTFVKAHPGAWDASRTRTGHGVRAATRLTLLSSRSSRHSGYSRDSRVTEAVAHDLLRACVDIGEGRRQERALPSNLRVTCLRSARTANPIFPSRRQEPALLGQQFIPPLRTDDAWCVAPLLGGARRIHPPRLCPRPRLTARILPRAPLCRYVPLGRAGDRSFKMKSKERHALLARYAARFNRPRDEAPPSKAGGDCGCD